MMTFEESMARRQTVSQMSLAALRAWRTLDKTARKLEAFNTLYEPPESIADALNKKATRLYTEADEAFDLYKALDKVCDRIRALPYISSYESCVDGKTITYICKGMLPNFKETSTDEAEALKMLEEYYAKSA